MYIHVIYVISGLDSILVSPSWCFSCLIELKMSIFSTYTRLGLIWYKNISLYCKVSKILFTFVKHNSCYLLS